MEFTVEGFQVQSLHYVVWKVGHGLCLSLIPSKDSQKRIQIDCGGGIKGGAELALNRLTQFSPSDLFISHFHKDHYNAITKEGPKEKYLSVESLYFPIIPRFERDDSQVIDNSQKFLAQILAMNCRLLDDTTDFVELSIIDSLKRLNKGEFKSIPLFAGMRVSLGGCEKEIRIEILWPPEYLKHKGTIAEIRNAMDAFEKACKTDRRLNELYAQAVVHASHFQKAQENSPAPVDQESQDNQQSGNVRGPLKDARHAKIPSETKEANEKLRKAANRLSLCFRIENEFLFLGDLENADIKRVIKTIAKNTDKAISFTSMITPHHGTHWHDCLRKLKVKYAVSSLGNGDRRYFKENHYKSIAENTPNTLINDVCCPECTSDFCNQVCSTVIQSNLEA